MGKAEFKAVDEISLVYVHGHRGGGFIIGFGCHGIIPNRYLRLPPGK
jgi:hypothetical protein